MFFSNSNLFVMSIYLYSKVIRGERLDIHLILDDPAGNSYMQVGLLCDSDYIMLSIILETSWNWFNNEVHKQLL